jgi:hypothetical protein
VGSMELRTGWKPGSLGTRSQAFPHSDPVKLCDEGEDPLFVEIKAGVEYLSSVSLSGCRRWPFDSMRSTADIVPVSRRGWDENELQKNEYVIFGKLLPKTSDKNGDVPMGGRATSWCFASSRRRRKLS